MTDAEIDARALKVIANSVPDANVPDTGITAATSLEAIDFASLELVETIMAMEEEFQIEVPDSVIDNADLVTVGDLMRLVREQVRAAG